MTFGQSVPLPASPPPSDPAELDPNAPLDPMPGLGVEWPDLKASDTTPLPATSAPKSSKSPVKLAAVGGDVRYIVQVEGLAAIPNSEDLLRAFRQQSTLQAERKDPANAAQIGRRASVDADLLVQLLRAQGYYDASAQPRTERAGVALQVILTADPGPQYHFASVALPGLDKAGAVAGKLRSAFAVKSGDPVIAGEVIGGGLSLTQQLGEEGFAQARLGEQDIEINHETHVATLVLPVDPGPVARFGTIRVSGRPPFSAHHVGIIARFKRGEPFQRSKLDDLRRALIATTLVANADIRVIPAAGGRVADMDIHLEPAPSHTIAGELGYGTGQGARLEASWTDRNFVNPEGALTIRGVAGTTEQLFGGQLRRSNFLQRDQTLNLQATASHQKFAAYTAKTV